MAITAVVFKTLLNGDKTLNYKNNICKTTEILYVCIAVFIVVTLSIVSLL